MSPSYCRCCHWAKPRLAQWQCSETTSGAHRPLDRRTLGVAIPGVAGQRHCCRRRTTPLPHRRMVVPAFGRGRKRTRALCFRGLVQGDTRPVRTAPDQPDFQSAQHGDPPDFQSVGHADLVQTTKGSWAAVNLGTRPRGSTPGFHVLGRETFLACIEWADACPVFQENAFEVPPDAGNITDTFTTSLLEPSVRPMLADSPRMSTRASPPSSRHASPVEPALNSEYRGHLPHVDRKIPDTISTGCER